MKRYGTLDFVIKNEEHMMAFLHVTGRRFYDQVDGSFLRIFETLKMKMKLGYECWNQGKDFKHLILEAIKKSIDEKLVLASAKVQKCIRHVDGVPDYFSGGGSESSVDLDAVYENE